MEYSAKEVAEQLNKEGLADVTSRTVNYYAFDKKMFDINSTGKKCFTEVEIEKIKAIKKLQESTKFTLEQIKEIINKYSYQEIESRFNFISYKNVQEFEISYNTKNPFSLIVDNNDYSAIGSRSFSSCNDNFTGVKQNNLQRNLRINENITLTISENIDTEKLQKIVKSIQNILNEK